MPLFPAISPFSDFFSSHRRNSGEFSSNLSGRWLHKQHCRPSIYMLLSCTLRLHAKHHLSIPLFRRLMARPLTFLAFISGNRLPTLRTKPSQFRAILGLFRLSDIIFSTLLVPFCGTVCPLYLLRMAPTCYCFLFAAHLAANFGGLSYFRLFSVFSGCRFQFATHFTAKNFLVTYFVAVRFQHVSRWLLLCFTACAFLQRFPLL